MPVAGHERNVLRLGRFHSCCALLKDRIGGGTENIQDETTLWQQRTELPPLNPPDFFLIYGDTTRRGAHPLQVRKIVVFTIQERPSNPLSRRFADHSL